MSGVLRALPSRPPPRERRDPASLAVKPGMADRQSARHDAAATDRAAAGREGPHPRCAMRDVPASASATCIAAKIKDDRRSTRLRLRSARARRQRRCKRRTRTVWRVYPIARWTCRSRRRGQACERDDPCRLGRAVYVSATKTKTRRSRVAGRAAAALRPVSSSFSARRAPESRPSADAIRSGIR